MHKPISHQKLPNSRRKSGSKLAEDDNNEQAENLSFAMYSFLEEQDQVPKEQKPEICSQTVNSLQQFFVKNRRKNSSRTLKTSRNQQYTQEPKYLKQTKSQINNLKHKHTVFQEKRKNTGDCSNKQNYLILNNAKNYKTPTVGSHKKRNEAVGDLKKVGKSGTKQGAEILSNKSATSKKLSRNYSTQSMTASIRGNDNPDEQKYAKDNKSNIRMRNTNKQNSEKDTSKDTQNKDIKHSEGVKKGNMSKFSQSLNTNKRVPILTKKKDTTLNKNFKEHRSISEKIIPKMYKSSTLSRQKPNYYTGTKVKDKIKKLGMDRNAVSIIIEKQTTPSSEQSIRQKQHIENQQINQELFEYLLYGDSCQTRPKGDTQRSEISEESEEILLEGYHHSSVNEPYYNKEDNGTLHHSLQPHHLNNPSIHNYGIQKNKIDVSPIIQTSNCKSFESELSYSQLFRRNFSDKMNKINFQSQYSTNLPVGALRVSYTSSGYLLRLDQQYLRRLLLTEYYSPSNQKMFNYIRVQDSIIYQRLFSNFKENPSNIYNLYMSMYGCSDFQKLTHKLRQYLFCKNIIFNKAELNDFIQRIMQMSQCIGLKLDTGIDAGILLEIIFLTNSINSPNSRDSKQWPIHIDQTQIMKLIVNNNNSEISIWSIVQEIHENIKNQLDQQTGKTHSKNSLSVTEVSLNDSSFFQYDHSSYRTPIQNHANLLKVIAYWFHQLITIHSNDN